MKTYWHIEGYDGLNKIFDKKVIWGCYPGKSIQNVLRALAARGDPKGGLNFDEIVGAYAKRKTNIANDLLKVSLDFNHQTWSCGDTPYFLARVTFKDEQGNWTYRAPVSQQ